MLPLLLVLTYGVVELSQVVTARTALSYAVREGLRQFEVSPVNPGPNPDPGIIQHIKATMQSSGLNVNNLQSISLYHTSQTGQAGINEARQGLGDLQDVYTFTNGVPYSTTLTYTVGTTATTRTQGDTIGVSIQYRYYGMTPLLDHGINMSDNSNAQLDLISVSGSTGGSANSMPTLAPPPTAIPTPTPTP